MLPPFFAIFKMAAIEKKKIAFPYFMNSFTYNINIRLNVYISGYYNFKYGIFGLIRHSHPPFLKMAAVFTNVAISYQIWHLES